MRSQTLVTTLAAAVITVAGLAGTATYMPSALAQGAAATASNTLSLGEIVQRLEAAGYTAIEKVERERDYYEAKATDPQGRRVEIEVDPLNGQVLKTETRKDKSTDKSRDDRDNGDDHSDKRVPR